MRADQVVDSLGRGVTSPYAIKVTSADEELPGLEEDWNRLSEASEHPNVFMTYGWFSAWSRRLQKTPGRFAASRAGSERRQCSGGHCAADSPRIIPVWHPGTHARIRHQSLRLQRSHCGRRQCRLTGAVVDFLARTANQWEILDLRNLRNTGNSIAHIEGAWFARACDTDCSPKQNGALICQSMPPCHRYRQRNFFCAIRVSEVCGRASEGYRVEWRILNRA